MPIGSIIAKEKARFWRAFFVGSWNRREAVYSRNAPQLSSRMGVSLGAWTPYLKRMFSRSLGFTVMSHSTRPVSLSSFPPPRAFCFDLHILVVGERELVVDHDADGLLLRGCRR